MQAQVVLFPNQGCRPLSPLQNRNLSSLLWPCKFADNWTILTQECRTRSTLNVYAVRAGMFISFSRAVATIWTERVFSNPNINTLSTSFFWVAFIVFECPSGLSVWGCGDSNFPLSIYRDAFKQPLSRDLSQERKQVSGGCVFWHRNCLYALRLLPPAPSL